MPELLTPGLNAPVPPPTQTDQSRATLTENFDTFLSLLTTQLQNQDPLDPVDSSQFTEQLVQFSQVEQQIQTNATLDRLVDSQNLAATNAALSFLNRNVAVVANTTFYTPEQGALWEYVIPPGAEAATLTIQDSQGRVVFSQRVSATAGTELFEWDGFTANGTQAPEGIYRLSVDVDLAGGEQTEAEVRVLEPVTGIEIDPVDGPLLATPFGSRRLDEVIAVTG